ncbi:hypothetical protein PR202_ga06941 [Eleusine coracana subsp. coracana]|uniref:Uncharacterized protein n=1 Tax=Eleusine coracana subsp. coracana TaxID=191504 RepID=A0AAV5BXY5_ELECO|nr:hypothetical protein PR202_ga06941 [Eleusine coracana subsp. coracana]
MQASTSISSPVPVAWHPTLVVAVVAVGLMLTASFMYVHPVQSSLPLRFFSLTPASSPNEWHESRRKVLDGLAMQPSVSPEARIASISHCLLGKV